MPSTYRLGLAHEHDSGIALFEEQTGKMIYAANEERFNRQKFTTALPAQALADAFKTTGIPAASITSVALGSRFHVSPSVGSWKESPGYLKVLFHGLSLTRVDRLLFGTRFGAGAVLWMLDVLTRNQRKKEVQQFLEERGIRVPSLRIYDHHHAHAASAYAGSGHDEALVITLDAQGDGDCSRVYLAKGGKMELKHQIPFFHSPGHYYEYVTFLLGFKPGREGKVTGLAALGDPAKTLEIFQKRIRYDDKRHQFVNEGYYRLTELNYLERALHGQRREDISAGIQKHLEDLVCAYITDVVKTVASASAPVRLVLAGGVFANVKLNQRISELSAVKDVFIFPHMGDGGLPAGAAMASFLEDGKPTQGIEDLYLGTPISDERAEAEFKQRKIVYEKPANLAEAVAQELANGHVVAVTSGRMEYGPRALGNRTLLYQATDATVNDWLNKRLNRSEFMPFAPIMRKQDLPDYFSGHEKAEQALQYMTITLQANERCLREAPAIVHVDQTARPQTVTPVSNPFIHEILTKYYEKTGLHILINTSFNMHEEPIVCNEYDAVRAFLMGNIDVLVLGSYIAKHPDLKST